MRSWIVLAIILACSIVPAFGSPIFGAFAPPTGDQGASHDYGIGPYIVTATAFGPNTPHLFGKNDGGDEIGVGLTNDPSGDHEIIVGSYIQLDLVNILGFVPLSITMNSTTNPEGWKIFETSTAGTLPGSCTVGVTCWTGTDENGLSISPTLRYLDITATSGNVLLSSLAFDDGGGGGGQSVAPEPVSFLLAGTGLIGMYFVRRRRTGSR